MDGKMILDKLLEEKNGYIRLIDALNEGVSKYMVLNYIYYSFEIGRLFFLMSLLYIYIIFLIENRFHQ